MIKNKKYDGTRLTLVGKSDGDTYYHYSEAEGNRFFVNPIGDAVPSMDSVSFRSHLTFTSSGTQSWDFALIPMYDGESVMIETTVSAMDDSGTKGYVMSSFGGYKHSGTVLSVIGTGMKYTTCSDFVSASASFIIQGSQSVNLKVVGDFSEVIDWDIHINYTKGYHTIFRPGTGGVKPPPDPWYPPPAQT